ncbi:Hypothetical protein NGK_1374 [Neisseria gonorrhoeae NCCP11945]|uniref:Uncharacterized protein n=1 Tax=Neisseria gonorrhoeae (strain NCCP11945) TaxID=521006 RepID=B4RML4_NEIG2|nr:Hypothetical protein NGK_1374 [Neisseria gonorrhoeae NCCP11945]
MLNTGYLKPSSNPYRTDDLYGLAVGIKRQLETPQGLNRA